jgi:hypothetical protein
MDKIELIGGKMLYFPLNTTLNPTIMVFENEGKLIYKSLNCTWEKVGDEYIFLINNSFAKITGRVEKCGRFIGKGINKNNKQWIALGMGIQYPLNGSHIEEQTENPANKKVLITKYQMPIDENPKISLKEYYFDNNYSVFIDNVPSGFWHIENGIIKVEINKNICEWFLLSNEKMYGGSISESHYYKYSGFIRNTFENKKEIVSVEKSTTENKKNQDSKFIEKKIKEFVTDNDTNRFTYYYLTRYYPKNKYPDLPIKEHEDRIQVWNFKDGKSTQIVAKKIAVAIQEAQLSLNNSCIVVIPASTQEKTVNRFQKFTEEISELLKIENCFDAIKTENHKETKGQVGGNKISHFIFDKSKYQNKNVLLFDDVITTGTSFKQVAAVLMIQGALSVTGIFLAKTSYKD